LGKKGPPKRGREKDREPYPIKRRHKEKASFAGGGELIDKFYSWKKPGRSRIGHKKENCIQGKEGVT